MQLLCGSLGLTYKAYRRSSKFLQELSTSIVGLFIRLYGEELRARITINVPYRKNGASEYLCVVRTKSK